MDTMEMRLADPILGELAHEAVATRKTLERVPEEHFDYKPHEKSMPLGMLASHLAEIPGWAGVTLDREEFVMEGEYKPWIAKDRQELLAKWDESLAAMKALLTDYPNDKMMVNWRFKMGDQVIFEMPRIGVMRSMILNHLIHHRAQLGVYLRMLDIPVPSVYGPSADEQG